MSVYETESKSSTETDSVREVWDDRRLVRYCKSRALEFKYEWEFILNLGW